MQFSAFLCVCLDGGLFTLWRELTGEEALHLPLSGSYHLRPRGLLNHQHPFRLNCLHQASFVILHLIRSVTHSASPHPHPSERWHTRRTHTHTHTSSLSPSSIYQNGSWAMLYWCCRRSWTSLTYMLGWHTLRGITRMHTPVATTLSPVTHETRLTHKQTNGWGGVGTCKHWCNRWHTLWYNSMTRPSVTDTHTHTHTRSQRVKLTAGGVSATVWRIPGICSGSEAERQIRDEKGGWQDERQRGETGKWEQIDGESGEKDGRMTFAGLEMCLRRVKSFFKK